ncbi:MAG: hypothetical protein DKM22_00955 [Candidatus Melainabacteria bacterium]|nr:MAG: hypothetical protein DKM22_00955 [Candidatus Melainabacteria bacterium]
MKNKGKILIFLFIIFLLCLYLSLFENYQSEIIYKYIRIPNTIKSIIAGSTLALSGMFLQAISKNPLAEPYLTGISSGAALGIVISILFFDGNFSFFGFLGAIIAALCVILFCGLSKFSVKKLILTGLSFNIFASSIIGFLILLYADKTYSLTMILTGGFSNIDISNQALLLILIAGILISSLFVPRLNYLRLDLGTEKNSYIIAVVVLCALLTSFSVYALGIIGFVGIIAPHISRIIFGNDYRYLYFSNILIGSSFLLFANYLSRTVLYPQQVPIGIITALIGVPIFIFFLIRKEAND